MMQTYQIRSIQDLLSVPIDRREACMRDLMYALALHELAFGDNAATTEIGALEWIDDGKHDITMKDMDGNAFLSLETTEQER
jgi:hypothetical protein